jgi:hypothetical protein
MGDRETRRGGDKGRGRQGGKEKGRRGKAETEEGGTMGQRIRSHRDLEVYQMGFEAAMRIFEVTKGFPKEERYSLVDQIRRSSRAVCANIAEAWR